MPFMKDAVKPFSRCEKSRQRILSVMNKTIKVLVLAFFALACTGLCSAFAGADGGNEISWNFLIIGLFGGLALFLYGMEQMSDGMKMAAGDGMRSILSALTQNRVIGLFVGAFVTMVIQSSSATTVMLVGFVQAGFMSFARTMGVILGGGIGTTITAQLIAFKLTDYALLMVAIGFAMRLLGKSENIKNIGNVLLGFGLLFYGMKLMSDAMKPLRTYPEFVDLLKGLENPMAGIVVGAVLTALIQSSSAFAGIIIVLAQQGLITLEAGIPLIFGANVGTCITAALASIGTSRDAKRVAVAHILFKIAGVALFIFWIPWFAQMVRWIADYFGSDVSRQVANAHTIFNVAIGFAFLPFIAFFEKIIVKLLPDKDEDEVLKPFTWFIDETKIPAPSAAIDLARSEISRMAKLLWRMQRAIIIPFLSDEPRKDDFFESLSLIEGIEMREEKVNFLQVKLKGYLINISRSGLTEKQSDQVFGMMSIIKDMESMGDLIHRNMIPMIPKKQALESDFSDEGKEELIIYHEKVCKQLLYLYHAFAESDLDQAKRIMMKERKYLDLESQYKIRHLKRLMHEKKETVKTHEVHLELMDLMKQVVVYSSNIAQTFVNTCAQEQ